VEGLLVPRKKAPLARAGPLTLPATGN
jgi:hypothetical protein